MELALPATQINTMYLGYLAHKFLHMKYVLGDCISQISQRNKNSFNLGMRNETEENMQFVSVIFYHDFYLDQKEYLLFYHFKTWQNNFQEASAAHFDVCKFFSFFGK